MNVNTDSSTPVDVSVSAHGCKGTEASTEAVPMFTKEITQPEISLEQPWAYSKLDEDKSGQMFRVRARKESVVFGVFAGVNVGETRKMSMQDLFHVGKKGSVVSPGEICENKVKTDLLSRPALCVQCFADFQDEDQGQESDLDIVCIFVADLSEFQDDDGFVTFTVPNVHKGQVSWKINIDSGPNMVVAIVIPVVILVLILAAGLVAAAILRPELFDPCKAILFARGGRESRVEIITIGFAPN